VGALTITTLGAPGVLHDGVPCAFPIRKVFALTLYLAVTGQPRPRAQLVAFLWPEADEAHGLLSLRQALLRLRQALGADADQHLQTTSDLVRLDLGAGGRVDVALLAAAATSRQTPPEHRLAALQAYAGPFLDHLQIEDAPDFMDWVQAQRVHWDACYDRVAEHELRRLLDEGRAEEATELGQRWVVQRAESDVASRLLATAQAAAGDVAGAQVTLATVAEHWAELGLALSAETQALRAQLATLPAAASPPTPRRVLRLPFVGREEAFAQLRQAYHLAQAGSAGAALVLGEAGVGKSRLLGAFLRWVRVQRADVAVGHADELSGRLPYQPLMELLRERLARERAPDDLVENSWLVELQRLVPELHDRYPDLPLPVDDAAAGARLLEAIAQLGLALARRHPLVWVVDDLQWADEATRDALLALLKRWGDAQVPALVVCSVRSEEIVTSPSLEHWLAAARRTTAVAEVTLPPLSAQGTAETVTTLLGGSASAAICAWLYAETQGNPLYLVHVLQALVERGVVRWQDDDQPRLAADFEVAALEGWLPETLRSVLLQRVRRLEPAAQQTLAAAAVVGTRFDEELLVAVAEVEEEAVLSALELAERRLLLRAEGGHYRFAHDKVAEAVYGDLSLARRRVFHRRALRALETAGAATGAASAALARHALGAEDWEAAVRHSEHAALAAEQIGAHRDAVRYYEQTVHLLTTAPSHEALQASVSVEARERVYGPLGMLYARLGEQERAQALYADLLAEARRRGARALEGRLLRMQGQHVAAFQRDYATAQPLLEAGRQIAQEQGDVSGLLIASQRLAAVAVQREDLPRAREAAQQSVDLARASRHRMYLAQSLHTLADLFIWCGEWEPACAASEESLVLFAGLAEADPAADPAATTSEEPPPYRFMSAVSWATFFPQIAPLAQSKPTSSNAWARQWGRTPFWRWASGGCISGKATSDGRRCRWAGRSLPSGASTGFTTSISCIGRWAGSKRVPISGRWRRPGRSWRRARPRWTAPLMRPMSGRRARSWRPTTRSSSSRKPSQCWTRRRRSRSTSPSRSVCCPPRAGARSTRFPATGRRRQPRRGMHRRSVRRCPAR
jgi:DNA-binding SARP family transcriptional activator